MTFLNVEKLTRVICGLILHVINFSYPFVDTRNMYSSEGYKEEYKHLVFCLSFVSGTKPRASPGKQCTIEFYSPGQGLTGTQIDVNK